MAAWTLEGKPRTGTNLSALIAWLTSTFRVLILKGITPKPWLAAFQKGVVIRRTALNLGKLSSYSPEFWGRLEREISSPKWVYLRM
jgi:hypothetical protein